MVKETDEEYLERYQNKYGKLSEEGKKRVLDISHEMDEWTEEQWDDFWKLVEEVASIDLENLDKYFTEEQLKELEKGLDGGINDDLFA